MMSAIFFAPSPNGVKYTNTVHATSRVATPRLWLPIVIALAIAPGHAIGQSHDPFAALIREGFKNNLALARERLAEDQSEAAVRQARALYLPTFTFDARYSRTSGVLDVGDLVNPAYEALNQITGSNRFPTDIDATLPLAQETRFRLGQPIYNPAISANYDASKSLSGLQGAQLRAAMRRLAAEIQTAWLQHASASRVVELYQSTLTLVRENVRVNERLLAAGTITPEAVLRARADLSEVEQQLAEANERRDAARRAWNLLLDRPLETAVPTIPDAALAFDLPAAPDALVRTALARREELEQTVWGERAAEAQSRAASASLLPTVSFGVDYGVQGQDYRFGPDDDVLVASVVVQWTLFNGGRDIARRQQANLEARRARTQREEVARRIELEVRQSYDAARVASRAITTAADRVAAARRAFELVARRREEGLASQVEFIDARTAYTRAELNEILTRYSYAMRWVDLERAAALRDLDD
jgi:outer membrane protein